MLTPVRRVPVRWIALGTVALAALLLARSCFYVVQPSEMAGVRRFGVVTSAAPVGPGLHWKAPVDRVDHLQVSLTTFQVNDLGVYTIDNQGVRIGVGITYRVPPAAVFKLLYSVGGSGNVDIDSTLRPIMADRALRVFARRNTINISAERESIANEIRQSIQEAVTASFGIEVVDLQLSRIEYSAAFTQSVEAAVRAKNDALQAENTVARIRYEGEQTKVQAAAQAIAVTTKAEGEARAAVIRAGAERESNVLRARGEAEATALTGAAQAQALQVLGAAVAANPRVVDYQTTQRWDGKLPMTMAGGAVPLLNLATPPASIPPAFTPGSTPGR